MVTVYRTRDGVKQEMECGENAVDIRAKNGWSTEKPEVKKPEKVKNDDSKRDSKRRSRPDTGRRS